jgi:hypothetical protein
MIPKYKKIFVYILAVKSFNIFGIVLLRPQAALGTIFLSVR